MYKRQEIDSINEQYLSEFLEALQTSINQMSSDGTRISYVTSRSRELGQYMAQTLDEEWTRMPVSYTHLDVYKRQPMTHSAGLRFSKIQTAGAYPWTN